MKERFKDIKGYDRDYQVSNLGRVKSLKFGKEKILKICIGSNGYLLVRLCKNGKTNTSYIHRLVAETFLQKPRGWDIVVDHINNDRLDNRLDNIQWITHRENCSKDKNKGTSKIIGVSWNKRDSKWMACIWIDGKNKHLGLFTSELEASQAYQNALKELNS